MHQFVRLGMLTGRKRTVAYWATSTSDLGLFHSRNVRGKDGAGIGKVQQNRFFFLTEDIPLCGTLQ